MKMTWKHIHHRRNAPSPERDGSQFGGPPSGRGRFGSDVKRVRSPSRRNASFSPAPWSLASGVSRTSP